MRLGKSTDFVIYNNALIIKPFEKKYINKKFVSFLNNPKVNKFLRVGKKKQTISSAKQYYNSYKNRKDVYCAILDKKKSKLIGTITLKHITNDKCFIGFMIGNTNYFGSSVSKQSLNIFLHFVFNYFNYKIIKAETVKENLSSNFTLIINGFKLTKTSMKFFTFELKKKNLKLKYKYKTVI